MVSKKTIHQEESNQTEPIFTSPNALHTTWHQPTFTKY